MEMVPLKPAVMMVVEIHVEHAQVDKNVAEEHVCALPIVQEDNAEMMDVVESHVDPVRPPKPAKTGSVQELPLLIVQEDNVVITEPEEIAVTVQLVKDAEPVFASATTTVTRETVVQPNKLMELTLVCALKDLVELVLPVSHVEQMDVVPLKHLATFSSL